jgi:hypothetical protein
MLLDPALPRVLHEALRPPRMRRPWLPLLSALLDLTQGQGELISHSERPWASVTFSGTRHRLTFVFNSEEAVAAGEDFIAGLPEHEFAIPGQLVADAAVVRVDHCALPTLKLTVEAELLLLDEG